jgi:hypothetical protein
VSGYLDDDDGSSSDLVDTFRGWLSDDGYEVDSDGGGGGLGRGVSSLVDGDGDGWGGTFGRIVDRLSGDGGRDGLWDRAIGSMADRFGSYLPEEVRNIAGQFLDQNGTGGRGSTWRGSLVDTGQTRVPEGWHAVGNHPTVGDSYGELGFGGFADHSLANLAGTHGVPPGSLTAPPAGYAADRRGMIAEPIPGRVPDPRVSMPADLVRPNPYADLDGDGLHDRPGHLGRPGYDVDGDSAPDRPVHDLDGDGLPDRTAHDDRVDYDDLVTSGASARPAYDVPDDPTFPAAVSGTTALTAEPPAVEAPASDFQQSIEDADQVEAAMDDVFEGPG